MVRAKKERRAVFEKKIYAKNRLTLLLVSGMKHEIECCLHLTLIFGIKKTTKIRPAAMHFEFEIQAKNRGGCLKWKASTVRNKLEIPLQANCNSSVVDRLTNVSS